MEKLLDFLRGANSMDKVALEQDPKKNLPLLSALLGIWNHNFLGHPTTAIIPYSQAMSRFPAHLQQCDMESNGKRIDKQGVQLIFGQGQLSGENLAPMDNILFTNLFIKEPLSFL